MNTSIKIILPILFCLMTNNTYTYCMNFERLDREVNEAVKTPKLPQSDMWNKLPSFLDEEKVKTAISSTASQKAFILQDIRNGVRGGAIAGLCVIGLDFLLFGEGDLRSYAMPFFSFLSLGSFNGVGVGTTLGCYRRFPFFNENPFVRTTSRMFLSITASSIASSSLLFFGSSQKVMHSIGFLLTWGLFTGITSFVSVGTTDNPEYDLLEEVDKEAVLKSYISCDHPELVKTIEISEVTHPKVEPKISLPQTKHVSSAPSIRKVNIKEFSVYEAAPPEIEPKISISQIIKHNEPLLSASAIYKGKLKNFYVTSSLNGSEIAYDLEDNSTLRNNKGELLKRLNADLTESFWEGVKCFDVVTGNYGRYKSGSESSSFFPIMWKKQPALIAWSKSSNSPPLILVAFKGTNFPGLVDALSGLKFLKKQLGEGNVHSGFFDVADSSIEKLGNKIAKICQNLNVDRDRVQILLTGHSMGAAVAAISGMRMLMSKANFPREKTTGNSNNNIIVMNFGQPRVWGMESVKTFQNTLGNENLVRFVTTDIEDRADPITGYRPEGYDTWGYAHFGERVPLRLNEDIWITLYWGVKMLHPLSSYRRGWEIAKNKN